MLGYKNKKREVYFFYVEVKRPNKPSKYQVEDDYCKLLKQLKNSFDIQITIGIQEPSAMGLLCEGMIITIVKNNKYDI